MSDDLAATSVLVTRPGERGEELVAEVNRLGGVGHSCPVLTQQPMAVPGLANATAESLGDPYDIAIFVSQAAVTSLTGQAASLPARHYLAVGPATATSLEQAAMTPVLTCPPPFASESLLGMAELAAEAVSGRRVVLVCGADPRPLLAETLRERGAAVTQVEVYRRQWLPPPAALRHWDLDLLTATSVDSLLFLAESLAASDRHDLLSLPIVVNSGRVAAAAPAMGYTGTLIVAGGADNQLLLAAMLDWKQTNG